MFIKSLNIVYSRRRDKIKTNTLGKMLKNSVEPG